MTYTAELDSLYRRFEAMNKSISDASKILKLLSSLPPEHNWVYDWIMIISHEYRNCDDVLGSIEDENERMIALKQLKGTSDEAGKELYTKERKNVIYRRCKKKGRIERYCKGEK